MSPIPSSDSDAEALHEPDADHSGEVSIPPPRRSSPRPPPPVEALQREVMPSNLPPAFSLPPTPESQREGVGALDPSALDAMVTAQQWSRLSELLGAPERVASLTPGQRFLLAMAQKEVESGGGPAAQHADRAAIDALAVFLGMSASATLPGIVARRALRRNWRAAPAPPARTSILLIIMAIVVGGFIGFMLGPGRDWFRQS